HATESFDARRIMVDRVVRARLTSKEDNKEWDEIGKLLKDGNGNRNKIAHYTIEYDVVEQKELPDGGAEFVFGQPRLQPSPFNEVSRLLGRTADKEGHNINPGELRSYIANFIKLCDRLAALRQKISPPGERRPEGLAAALMPYLDPLFEPPPVPKIPRQNIDPPSEI